MSLCDMSSFKVLGRYFSTLQQVKQTKKAKEHKRALKRKYNSCTDETQMSFLCRNQTMKMLLIAYTPDISERNEQHKELCN